MRRPRIEGERALEGIRERVDAFSAGVASRRASEIACRPGCEACCHVELEVSELEGWAIGQAVARLDDSTRALLHERAKAPSERCVMLDAQGRCVVYAERPLVCRTQGLPLSYPAGFVPESALMARGAEGSSITWCPLNFRGGSPAAADVLDAERVDTMHALALRAAGLGSERIALRALALAPELASDSGRSVVGSARPMNEESSPLGKGPGADPVSRAEAALEGGARLVVEVAGHAHAEALAARALAAARAEVEGYLGRPDETPPAHPRIVGSSAPMLALFKMLERIRNSDATVLVLGENGTGKELVARSIHDQSRRIGKQFVATNCSAFNDNLLESELFGHRRGSFTGAVSDKPGLFEVADGGTFFMDEVGDMSPALQVKLLRVLQEGVFMPVGGTETKKVDVRIIAATNRDLAAMVKKGTFREDLYYRLHVVSVRVPPLRERAGDVPVLVRYFLARLGKRDKREKVLTGRAIERLVAHEWPGNVRELENEMERLWVLSGDDRVIDEDLLSPSIGRRSATTVVQPAANITHPPIEAMAMPTMAPPTHELPANLPDAVETLERRMIVDELRKARGNKTKAAEALGISRRNLIRKVQAYGLDDAGKG